MIIGLPDIRSHRLVHRISSPLGTSQASTPTTLGKMHVSSSICACCVAGFELYIEQWWTPLYCAFLIARSHDNTLCSLTGRPNTPQRRDTNWRDGWDPRTIDVSNHLWRNSLMSSPLCRIGLLDSRWLEDSIRQMYRVVEDEFGRSDAGGQCSWYDVPWIAARKTTCRACVRQKAWHVDAAWLLDYHARRDRSPFWVSCGEGIFDLRQPW